MEENINHESSQEQSKSNRILKSIIRVVVTALIIAVIGWYFFTKVTVNNFENEIKCLAAAANKHVASIEEECLKLTDSTQCILPTEISEELQAIQDTENEAC